VISEPRRPVWVVPMALLLVAVVLAAGYFAWRYFEQTTQAPATRSAEEVERNESGPQTLAPAAGRQVTSPSATESSVVTETVPRLDAQPRSPVEALTGDRPYKAASRENNSSDTSDQKPGNATGDDPATAAATSGTAAGSEQVAQDLRPRSPTNPATAPPPAPAVKATVSKPTVRDTPQERGVISYWQLPESTRNQLPAFKITVLVYDEVARNRFILMDGKRYAVGDTLAGNVRLLSIERDRAIFRQGAYRFFVTQR